MLSTLLIFVAVLSVLVLVHELGHFLVALKMGMDVEEFGIGFPPRAYSIERGGITYSFNWVPLGGFVKIKGESGQYKDEPDSFAAKPMWQRFSVLVAGVVMNFVLAAVIFSIGYMIGMPGSVNGQTPDYAHVEDASVQIVSVVPGSPADQAELPAGSTLVSVDGREMESAERAREYIGQSGEDGVRLQVLTADGEERQFALTPAELEQVDGKGVGIALVKTGIVSFPPHMAVVQGVSTTGTLTWEVTKAFGRVVRNLVVGDDIGVDLSGPVGIAVMTGEAADMGFVYLMQFTAILSINLAVINILPFPALDGGRVVFLAIEAVRGKPADEKLEALVHNSGFALLMLLVILVTYRDLVRFGDRIWGVITGLA